MIPSSTRKIKRLGWKENYIGWLYCLPILVGIALFTVTPIVLSIYSTVLDWSGYKSIFAADFVGLRNITDVFAGIYSKMFYTSFLNTFAMMLNIPLSMLLGMLLAMGMNRKMVGAKVFRILYYLPGITSVVAVTVLFQKLFAFDGTINRFLGTFGIANMKWLTDDVLTKVTINILILWKGVGYSSLMYLAGLQSVSKDQVEASQIDGAGAFKRFTKIVLPALYPITFHLLVTSVMNGLQLFNEPFILLKYGVNNNGLTPASFVYYFYKENNLGVAAVGAWALAAVVFVFTAVQIIVDNRKEKY